MLIQQVILDSAKYTIISTNLDGTIVTFNRAAERLLGYSAAEVIGKTTPLIFHDSNEVAQRAKELSQELGIAIEPGFEVFIAKTNGCESEEREWSYIRKNGSRFPVLLSVTILHDQEDNIVGFVGIGSDITERKQAEVALLESEQRWQLALRGNNDGIWDWNVKTNEVFFSSRWKEMLGYEDHEIVNSLDEWAKRVHPDDLAWVTEEIQAHFAKKTPFYNTEHRVLCKDGSYKWILDRGQALWDENGNVVRMTGSHTDITEHKQAEEALRRREQEFKALVENSPDIIARIDRELRYIYINPAGKRELAIFSDNLIGKTIHDLSFPDEVLSIMKQAAQVVFNTGKPQVIETALPSLQGYKFYQSRFVPEFNAEGITDTILIIDRDITQLKRTEIALQRANEELEMRVLERTTQLRTTLTKLEQEISDRKLVEQALRESERQYAILAETAPVGIFLTDVNGNALYLNERWCQITGIPVQEGIGNGWIKSLHPDDKERIVTTWYQAAQQNIPFCSEYRVMSPDARITWVYCQAIAETNSAGELTGYIGTITDISARKFAEEALRKSDELYRTFARNFPNGSIFLFDQDLRYKLADGTGLAKVNLSKEQLEGKTIWEALSPENCALIEPMYRSALSGETKVYEISYQNCIYQVHALPVKNEQGEIFAGMLMTQDITMQKQAELALKNARDELEIRVEERTKELSTANAALQIEIAERLEAQQQLEILTKDLQRSNQELEQFAYIASHDLQEPLRAITSYTQMLAKRYQGQLDAKADTYIGFIIDGAARMRQLIQDILAYSRVGRRELKLQPIDCNKLLSEVLNDLQLAIVDSQAKVTFSNPLPTIMADPIQIRNLWQNLIGNAIKYRSEASPLVAISVSQEKDKWLFAIRDNGIGIEPEYRERIFTIFQRLHTSDEYPGTGIGLAICQKIVERHRGKIWCESELGQGSTFLFTIPI